MESGIELQQKFLIPVLLVDDKWEQDNFTEAVNGFFKAGEPSNGITAQALMGKDHVLVV